ncbi:MAG TPA: MMPL family transporter [Vicinamibacteria bacterium]
MGFASFVVRRRRLLALVWLLAAAALAPLASRLEGVLAVSARIPRSESAEVERLLARRFASPFAQPVVLVATGLPALDSPEGTALLRELVADLEAHPGVAGTLSYLDHPGPEWLGREGTATFVIVGLAPDGTRADDHIPPLRAASAAFCQRHSGLALRWTGEAALNFDLRRASEAQARGAERRALPLTLALLFVAFGAAVAAALPVGAAVIAIVVALGLAALLAREWPLSILLGNVVSMLGLGLGIDYALLAVSRFREALDRGCGPEDAAADAARHAGRTVAVSGAAVAMGFLGLLLVPVTELRSVGVGGILVVAVSVALTTTLLPGVLAWLGPRVDRGRLRRRRPGAAGGAWRRWGHWVAARPGRALLVGGLPLVLLALPAARLRIALPRGDWLPPALESAQAAHELAAMGHRGAIHTVRLVLELPEGTTVGDAEGWRALQALTRRAAADPRVARVHSLSQALAQPGHLVFLPPALRRAALSPDGRATLMELVPREEVEPDELVDLVRSLRAQGAPGLTGMAGSRMWVGGLPAFSADYRDAVAGRFARVVGLVVGGTFLFLAVGFRSLLVPLKAVLLNLLSVAGAFGATVLVFQEGHGASWLGLAGATGGVFPAVPVLVFCTVFGLSMDYEVFLVARVAEARRAGADEAGAVADGLAHTGGIITSAAAVMVVVFAAFTLGDFLLIKMLGFALAVAVLLDATLIRVAVGPAVLRLAGRWNWWPGGAGARPSAIIAPCPPPTWSSSPPAGPR